MKTLGYYNGEIGELDELRIPMNDRAGYFGDGVYDATCAANHVPFALNDHIARFFRSAALIELNLPLGPKELKELLLSLSAKVDDPGQLVYWQASRGTAPRSHAFPEGALANIWVMIRRSRPS